MRDGAMRSLLHEGAQPDLAGPRQEDGFLRARWRVGSRIGRSAPCSRRLFAGGIDPVITSFWQVSRRCGDSFGPSVRMPSACRQATGNRVLIVCSGLVWVAVVKD